MATQQFDPPSGTRDFLADEVRKREHVFSVVREVYERYGFEPLQTPAFERLEILSGKYGDEGDKLVFKILRRGEHEVSGEADLALRYDMTVPLARVVAAYGSRLPTPYKRYVMGLVWRADRPGKGRFREFAQCDVDIVGSTSPMADAEAVAAAAAALDALGLPGFKILVNSRQALSGLLDVYGVPVELGNGVLVTLDKLDKLTPDAVVRELTESRSLDHATAREIVGDLTAEDATDRLRTTLKDSDAGLRGLCEIDRFLELAAPSVGADRIAFTPRLVRGLDYYTGVIFEFTADGVPGSIASGGRYDHLIEALGGPDVPACGVSLGVERILLMVEECLAAATALDVAVAVLDEGTGPVLAGIAGQLRHAGLRAELYLGSSRKLARQLKWAAGRNARYAVIYGPQEHEAGLAIVRDMDSGEQHQVRVPDLAADLSRRAAARDGG
jgi:histidyl-tRNA synthetase